MDTRDLGNLGEDLACEYLVDKGFVILGRNYRITLGELDIIAKRRGLFSDNTIHFVEVKSLAMPARDFFPEDRVDYKKQKKIKRLAEIWLQEKNYQQSHPYQIDIVAVSINNGKNEISFFENVVNG